jgi:alpha-amylase
MLINGVLMQYFHWYISPKLNLWNQVKRKAGELADAGFTAVWLPPAYKGMAGLNDVGYAVYDLYDLGEFDQRDSVRTKYGTRHQYLAAIKALQSAGIQVYADAVLNHRMGGEGVESVRATPFPNNDRLHPKGEMREIKAYTHFAFPGRKAKHSDFEWHWWHFDAVDYDEDTKESGTLYLVEGKNFDDYVALENGNFTYLMGCDIDYQNQKVRSEIIRWGKWCLDTTGIDGFRLDAIKHISAWFFPQWIDALEQYVGRDLFVAGDYWFNNLDTLQWYVGLVGGRMSVFDVPLHYNFHYASRSHGNYDMRKILDGSMIKAQPTHAVTFVENHDSQPLQALESPVDTWFKPLAYAIILLRSQGYPSVFYADYYGTQYEDYGKDGNRHSFTIPSLRWWIDKFLYVRKHFAYGPQNDYFDHYNTLGWTRLGNAEHPKAMAVIMSDGPPGYKWMEVDRPHAKFTDFTGKVDKPVYTNEWGWGEFRSQGESVSVWIEV